MATAVDMPRMLVPKLEDMEWKLGGMCSGSVIVRVLTANCVLFNIILHDCAIGFVAVGNRFGLWQPNAVVVSSSNDNAPSSLYVQLKLVIIDNGEKRVKHIGMYLLAICGLVLLFVLSVIYRVNAGPVL